jgi:hypothetical protein
MNSLVLSPFLFLFFFAKVHKVNLFVLYFFTFCLAEALWGFCGVIFGCLLALGDVANFQLQPIILYIFTCCLAEAMFGYFGVIFLNCLLGLGDVPKFLRGDAAEIFREVNNHLNECSSAARTFAKVGLSFLGVMRREVPEYLVAFCMVGIVFCLLVWAWQIEYFRFMVVLLIAAAALAKCKQPQIASLGAVESPPVVQEDRPESLLDSAGTQYEQRSGASFLGQSAPLGAVESPGETPVVQADRPESFLDSAGAPCSSAAQHSDEQLDAPLVAVDSPKSDTSTVSLIAPLDSAEPLCGDPPAEFSPSTRPNDEIGAAPHLKRKHANDESSRKKPWSSPISARAAVTPSSEHPYR